MSLYHEATALLTNANGNGGTLKARIYRHQGLRNKPAQVYALASSAILWSPVLKQVVEHSGILISERKLSPTLAMLLVHDLLVSPSGVSAPAKHPLKVATLRHQVRLRAEFVKLRLRYGFCSVEAFREYVNSGLELKDNIDANITTQKESFQRPRWIRVNLMKTDLDMQLQTTFSSFSRVGSVQEVAKATHGEKVYYIDTDVDGLLAFSPRLNLSRVNAYLTGDVVFQDKAACFPVVLMDWQYEDGDVLDACAAPGNKTTHIAAVMVRRMAQGQKRKVFACERDELRAKTLEKMVRTAGVGNVVQVKAGQDFLAVDPDGDGMASVGALLLDPSCSGSGMIGMTEPSRFVLPRQNHAVEIVAAGLRRNRRRKWNKSNVGVATDDNKDEKLQSLKDRLAALSAFQLKILLHAMRFPCARKILYSTCSIYCEENEQVVMKALMSTIALERGWKILTRKAQVEPMRNWRIRGLDICCDVGDYAESLDMEEIAESCIRCEKGTDEGTMGFFVAAFVRDVGDECLKKQETPLRLDEEEWEGFSD